MLIVVFADITYMLVWSSSLVLDITISMWILVMIPTILVYIRGDGEWKKIN
ncbi:Uncharacterised protein [uncultured archaeon]|nr:Uncharacterised protein [uncultured archaeon]